VARETIIAGPYHSLIPYAPRLRREWDETWERESPHRPTRGLGERRKLHRKGVGRPRPKMDFIHI